MSAFDSFWALFGDVLIALWFGLTLLAAIVGLWALLSPNSFIQFNQRLSTWISMDKSDVARPAQGYKLEKPFYKYHLVSGPLIILAAIYVLYEAIFVLSREKLSTVISTDASMLSIWTEVLIDAAFGWIYISGIIALLIGAIVTIRPSYLKSVENRLNTWVETENTVKKLDKSLNLLDEWVCGHPRLFGILSLSGSVLVALAMMKFGYIT